jgi:hypothetical protein
MTKRDKWVEGWNDTASPCPLVKKLVANSADRPGFSRVINSLSDKDDHDAFWIYILRPLRTNL